VVGISAGDRQGEACRCSRRRARAIGARISIFVPASDALALSYVESETVTRDPKVHLVDTLARAPESRFTQLHECVEGQAAPPLRDAFVMHLDWVCGTGEATDAQRLRLALVRLERERPDLHAAVALMAEPKATVRSVAPVLGVSPKTVCVRHKKGLDILRHWCQEANSSEASVA